MFDTTWSDPERFANEARVGAIATCLDPSEVRAAVLLEWSEHCLECAPPACYRTCERYRMRADRKCARLAYGMLEAPQVPGLLGYGIDLRFEPWGKIEAQFDPRQPAWRTPTELRRIASRSRRYSRAMLGLSRITSPISPTLRPSRALAHCRSMWLGVQRPGHGLRRLQPDALVIECYAPDPTHFRLQLRCTAGEKTLHAGSVPIAPGHNYHEVPYGHLGLDGAAGEQTVGISIFPENDLRCRLIFSWLDLVAFWSTRPRSVAITPDAAEQIGPKVDCHARRYGPPAEKVKCVAWDLDGTLWRGVLVEDGIDALAVNDEAVAAIRELDRRGIIHTVLSKNAHAEAWPALQRFGLADYFICPAINWGAKPENLKQVAEQLNIGLDAFAFVDDSPRERLQMTRALPMVRVFSERHARELAGMTAFDVPVTEMSARRRQAYKDQEARHEFRARADGDDAAFVRSLGIAVEMFRPAGEAEKERCFELIRRTNQLNLSARRMVRSEFEALLEARDNLCFGFRASDRFGDYGIIGFVAVALAARPRISDLVISCRIARCRVEHAVIVELVRILAADGHASLDADLVRTERNGPLADLFEALPFRVVTQSGGHRRYSLADFRLVRDEKLVAVSVRP